MNAGTLSLSLSYSSDTAEPSLLARIKGPSSRSLSECELVRLTLRFVVFFLSVNGLVSYQLSRLKTLFLSLLV